MNRHDLLAQLIVSTAGWLKQTKGGSSDLTAWGLHSQLKEVAGIGLRRRRSGSLSRKARSEVFRAVNDATRLVVDTGVQALLTAERNGCVLTDTVDSMDNVETELNFSIREYLPLSDTLDALQMRQSIDKLLPRSQLQVMRMYRLWLQSEGTGIQLQFGASGDDSENADDLQAEHERFLNSFNVFKKNSSPKVLISFEDLTKRFGLLWSASLFVGVSPSFSNEELITISNDYLEMSVHMEAHLSISHRLSEDARNICKDALDTFVECGVCFAVLGSWIRSLALTERVRTCEICYRHLGHKEVKFCHEHRRKANQRQRADASHISKAFEARWQSFFASFKSHFTSLSAPNSLEMRPDEKLVSLAREWVHEELVQSTALLMHILNGMRDLISPTVENQMGHHFRRMVIIAQRAFDVEIHGAMDVKVRAAIYSQRTWATFWLNANSFFETFFGRADGAQSDPAGFIGSAALRFGLDSNHPIARGQPWPLRSLARDIAKYRCWVDAERDFSERAYLDVDKARDLLAMTDERGLYPSITEVAKQLGASKQALSYALKKRSGSVRDRILKKLKNELYG